MQRILSGMQPTGKLHIGNYLGALKNWVELQNAGNECSYVVVDLHALSGDFDPKLAPGRVLELATDYLAAGINPEKSTVFVQSQVPAHTELMWILSSVAPVSELQRMTQFKDKSARQDKNVNVSLFTYPILQAADILLYKPNAVPVGDDQKQHLELTNDLVAKFNAKFGHTFDEIKPLWTRTPRVMSLKDPEKKMSKSDPASCLFLDDGPEEIMAKLKKATAASETLHAVGIDSVPSLRSADVTKEKYAAFRGAINLMLLLAEFSEDTAESILRQTSYQYSSVKVELSHTIARYFEPFRERKTELLSRPDSVAEALGEGAHKARETAEQTLREVKDKIGLL